jgi:hypothetical protein
LIRSFFFSFLPANRLYPSGVFSTTARKITAVAGTPRWVKVFAAIAVIAIVLLLVVLLAGGEHGPGRHGLPAIDGRG